MPTKHHRKQKAKENLIRQIDRRSGEWTNPQIVRLGKDDSGLIQTGKPGIVWARMDNGRPIQVRTGTANVPARPDLHLVVARRKIQPTIWYVIDTIEDYDDPAGGGELTYHHTQHEEGGPDRVNLNRKQITARTVRVKNSASFIVQVFGDVDLTVNGWVSILHKTFNLTSYIPTSGARFVAIESDNNGALTVHSGTVFGSPGIASPAYYPEPDPGKYSIARILLYERQTALLDEHITVSMPPSFNPANYSDIAHVHFLDDIEDVNAPDPEDGQVLTWDIYAQEWIAADPTGSGSGGEDGGSSHVHGLARWNGASGQTTFELPDVWEYIDSVLLNGLEEDPLVYSLSADGTQIVLDTALASSTNVIAHGVIRSIS